VPTAGLGLAAGKPFFCAGSRAGAEKKPLQIFTPSLPASVEDGLFSISGASSRRLRRLRQELAGLWDSPGSD
jgi:hypothetical protein